ncbi:hypothetical protein FXO37_24073 [Capsicum annuum]|nr:hypothetical protein FXO37_24073 [Capsicum annuum]
MAQTENIFEEKEDWGRCLVAESRVIHALAFINLERDWIRYNTIHHEEKKVNDKNPKNFEDFQIGDMVSSIKEIKEADSEKNNKSLDMEDIEVDSEQTLSEPLNDSNDFYGENTKRDVVVVEVSDQSSIVLRSITISEQILKVDEKLKIK